MKCLVAICALLLLLAGCTLPESNEALLEFNENAEFGGLLLGMTTDAMQEELGEPDAESPITAGTEYAYHASDLSVVVNDEGVIRRLSSKNAEFGVFGVKVGDDIEAAGTVLEDNGYMRDAASGYRYNNNEVQIILLTVDNATVVGFTASWQD